jgi:hypothetical protein
VSLETGRGSQRRGPAKRSRAIQRSATLRTACDVRPVERWARTTARLTRRHGARPLRAPVIPITLRIWISANTDGSREGAKTAKIPNLPGAAEPQPNQPNRFNHRCQDDTDTDQSRPSLFFDRMDRIGRMQALGRVFKINFLCHSERSEESNWRFASLWRRAAPAGFFAPLRMTIHFENTP